MIKMVARAKVGGYEIRADDFKIGFLEMIEEGYHFTSNDKEFEEHVQERIAGDMSLGQILAEIRAVHETFVADAQAMQRMERYAENGYVRMMEGY